MDESDTLAHRPQLPPPATTALRENWGWLVAGLGGLVLLYFLLPILMPFVVGAALAYLGDPLASRLERLHLTRTGGVCIVFVIAAGVLALAAFLVVPMLEQQFNQLLKNLPSWLDWVQNKGLPALGIQLPPGVQLNGDSLRKILERNWQSARSILSGLLGQLGRSTPTVLATAINLLLIPILAFYLLRDWNPMMSRIEALIPPRLRPATLALAQETSQVLSGLIRGQLLVMLSLVLIYGIGLWFVGLHVALLVGLFAGALEFVPYLGFASGLVLACIAMLVQTQDPYTLIWVLVVFGVGGFLENAVLTPLLIGDRIGLHPVAVIFAILAGGQLFGFIGVLLSLPVSAVCAVLLRHARRRWLHSPIYQGRAAP